MTRQVTRQLRNSKHSTVEVTNNVWWLLRTWSKFGLPRNAYVDCKNIIISEKGWFKKRRTASQLWVEPYADLSRVYGIFYQKDFWWIRVKWNNIQTLSSPTATWTTIATWYNISGSNYVDFVEFKATSTSTWVSKTLAEASAERYLKVTVAMTPNEHIWKLLKIWSEVKLIIWNTDTIIYIQEKFENTYAISTTCEIVDQVTAVYIASPGQAMKIWRGGTALQTLSYDYNRIVLQSYGWLKNNGRLFALDSIWKKVKVSEVWTGEFFQKDSFLPINLNGDLLWMSEIGWRIIVYSTYGRVSIVWDSPDNFQVIPRASYKWTIAPGSIASWNNVQFYLSHEWIEFLNSIENSTVTEWISLSDNIKKIFERHTNLTRAHGTISNWKYYLSIQDWVYIYDLEKSVKNHKPIFTPAQFDECSQAVVSNAVAGEWTCSADVSGQLVFGQGWLVYRVTDEQIGPNDTQAKLKYMIEFPIEDFWNIRLDKAIQKYRLFLQNNPSIANTNTNIKIYLSKNWETYTLIREVNNEFEIECFLSEKARYTSIKIEFEDINTATDEIEFLYSELEFYFLNKR